MEFNHKLDHHLTWVQYKELSILGYVDLFKIPSNLAILKSCGLSKIFTSLPHTVLGSYSKVEQITFYD